MSAKKEAEYIFYLYEQGYININKVKTAIDKALVEHRILMAEQLFLVMVAWPKLSEEKKQELHDRVKKG